MHEFAELYDRWFTRVYNYVRYRVGDAAAADDVVSRVFERALDRLDRYDPARGAPDAWLFAIARSAVADHFRGRRPEDPLELAERAAEAGLRVEDRLARDEDARGLLAAMAALDERSREVLALKFGARMSHRDIAAHLGLAEGHVGVLAHRALKALRAALEAAP